MKYFGKAHLERSQVKGLSEDEYNQLDDAWENNIDEYKKYKKSIIRKIPKPIKDFSKKCFIHDASVEMIKEDGWLKFSIDPCWKPTKEWKKDDRITLSFKLVSDLDIGKFQPKAYWLYEEIELQTDKTWKYEILFDIPNKIRSLHEEMCIHFTEVKLEGL